MKHIRPLLISILAAALVTAIIALGPLHRVDRWVQDALCQQPGVTSPDIVLIGIDEETLEEFGPFGANYRTVMAMLLEKMAADPDQRPAVVALDILYDGESGTSGDARLAAAAEKLGCVVTSSMAVFGEEIVWEDGHARSRSSAAVDIVQPYEALRAVTEQGHINVMLDRDGILRHAMLYAGPDGQQLSSLAAVAARRFLAEKGKTLTLPEPGADSHIYITYTGLPGAYSDGASVAGVIYGQVSPSFWAGKIVLVGPYEASLGDAYFTTIDKGKSMYGVEFHANMIQSLLDGSLKTEIPDLPQLIALFLLCAAAEFLFLRMKAAPGIGVCAGLMLLGFGCTWLMYRLGWVTHVLWLPAAVLALFLCTHAVRYVQAVRERHALALEKERISTELALATRIQASSLPKTFPPFPDRHEFDIYASMTPAKEVGGDLYDFFLVDDDHLCMVIGDVSGKGVPASLFMMLSSALIHHVAMGGQSPAKILQTVNAEICSRNPEEMFVTVWLGVLELSTGRLTAANAGHEYPALRQPDGSFELIKDKHGLVIGGMEGVRYRDYELQLQPGAKLFVYTDGVPEATSAAEELFGTERMVAALRSAEDGSTEEILQAVNQAVSAFVGNAMQFDDLTMMCLHYHGPHAAEAPLQ